MSTTPTPCHARRTSGAVRVGLRAHPFDSRRCSGSERRLSFPCASCSGELQFTVAHPAGKTLPHPVSSTLHVPFVCGDPTAATVTLAWTEVRLTCRSWCCS